MNQDTRIRALEAHTASLQVQLAEHQRAIEALYVRAAHSLLPAAAKSNEQEVVTIHYSETDSDLRSALKAYFYAAVVIYGKCFVQAKGRGTKLHAKDYVEPAFMPVHNKILGFRHRLVAHAGEFDEGEAIVAVPQSGNRFHVAANIWRLDFEDDREQEIDMAGLFTQVKNKVEAKQAALLRKLLEGEAKAIARAHFDKN